VQPLEKFFKARSLQVKGENRFRVVGAASGKSPFLFYFEKAVDSGVRNCYLLLKITREAHVVRAKFVTGLEIIAEAQAISLPNFFAGSLKCP